MPPFPIVDAHLHLWDPAHLSYPWLDDQLVLRRAFTPVDFSAALSTAAGGDEHQIRAQRVAVSGAIFMEGGCIPEHSLREVEWVRSLASGPSTIGGLQILGIVAAHAVEKGEELRSTLETHGADPLVKGLRRLLQDEKEADYCLRGDFVAGVRLLAEFDLSFDLCVRHPQLASVVELVRRVPEVRFVLDHLGKPAIADGELDPWRSDLEALAALPNVHCKLSGLANEAAQPELPVEEARESWNLQDVEPYIAHALQCFGTERVMFGGDWPVLTLAGDYPSWLSILGRATAALGEQDQLRLWRENALDFYRIA